ncbi:MAG: 16S rRNA (uracil(1498)-N(3))-methyltransferase [Candidatus Azotimanducaceae bacterium]|uniref:Ribosomal RNA small subunit methyltransferase E n=1 Tax=OM182 bacterium TaxID=2510334 RepID=A0A520S5G6_9GAMM|nr:16S rRNA (uracil(1498)-N(3))-methyltransferase [Gammaproteobacteria bacterium]OUV68672.1 MAG: 16S rRNA (uracil(1498)-N(3))-methyltransferase [Gammaproteobacteria bacterium TMED133]RZO77674.1 MAG: 16S rRNA (uracil(1498)-N(3))-methyltransferase [OM182 bacterium]
MRTRRVFLDQELEIEKEFILPANAAHYVLRVLRMKSGEKITLINGDGCEYASSILKTHRSEAVVLIHSKNAVNKESKLISKLGLGILKRHAMESALARATELGVTEITPLITTRTNGLRPRENHWKQVIQSSCEQCGRNRLPRLQKLTALKTWLKTTETNLKLVAHPGSKFRLKEIASKPAAVSILIGPEGGLNIEEIQLALDNGFLGIDLGKRVLRAETVPAALMSIIQFYWGDIS